MTTTLTNNTPQPDAQQIRTLRRQGNLTEAYRQARQLLQTEPDNVWNRRALAWVYVDLLKEAATQPVVDRLLRGLQVCRALPMDASETTWREQVLWVINRFLFKTPPAQLPLFDLATLIQQSVPFLGSEPSLVRSVWLKGLLKHAGTGIDWLTVLAQWGWTSFRPDDLMAETLPDGKTVGPLAERVYMAVARQLIQQVPVLASTVRPVIEHMHWLIGHSQGITFLPYFQARLLHLLDERAEALAVFLPFAQIKQQAYWVWDMLSELIDGTPDEVIGCLVKGISLSTPESFLVKIRQKLASQLIAQHRWNEARTEIDCLVATRQREGWKIPAIVDTWTNDVLYTQAVAASTDWYADSIAVGESLLFADKPEEVCLVMGLDSDRQLVEIMVDAQTVGRFPYRRFGLTLAIGDRLAIRYDREQHDDKTRLRVYTARPSADAPTHLAVRQEQGVLRVNEKGFGHVGILGGAAIFVPVPLVAAHRDCTDQVVVVSACQAWDTRKQIVGWKAFQIRRI